MFNINVARCAQRNWKKSGRTLPEGQKTDGQEAKENIKKTGEVKKTNKRRKVAINYGGGKTSKQLAYHYFVIPTLAALLPAGKYSNRNCLT